MWFSQFCFMMMRFFETFSYLSFRLRHFSKSYIPRSSMRFGTTLLGATLANLSKIARIMEHLCLDNKCVLCTVSSSVSDEQLTRVRLKVWSNLRTNIIDMIITKKLHAETREYCSCNERLLMAHCNRWSKSLGRRA